MVGPAYTLRYIPAREDIDSIDVFRSVDHPQRRAVEEVPPAHVLVMDCRQDSSAASAGSILVTRLQVRGCAGIVTDGGLRDVDDISALEMPAFYARPSAPTNLTKHHAVDLNVPIGCGGVAVYPGDIVVGDGDGVVIVPVDLVDSIVAEAKGMEEYEAWVMEQVKAGASILGLYPMNDENRARYEIWLSERE